VRTVKHGATADTALRAIEGYLEQDTPWETVDKLIAIFAEKGGYEEKHIGTPFEIFTKCLGVTKAHPKYKTIKDRYYASRRERVRELRDEGLSPLSPPGSS
jgi:hypothetical protein